MSILEKDWKYASGLRNKLLERLCERINLESVRILNDLTLSQHEKYLLLYKHINESDKLIALGFDNWKRSNALQCLSFYYQQGLFTDLEYNGFSLETQKVISF